MRSLIRKQPAAALAFGVAAIWGILFALSADVAYLLIFYLIIVLVSPWLGQLFAKTHHWLQAKGYTSRLAQMVGGVVINSGLALLIGLTLLPLAFLVGIVVLVISIPWLITQFEDLHNILNLFGFFLLSMIIVIGPVISLGHLVIYLLLVVLFFSCIYPWVVGPHPPTPSDEATASRPKLGEGES